MCLLKTILSIGFASMLCGALSCQSTTPKATVKTGLDIVVEKQFAQFAGKRVGIICNHTACDKTGKHIVDLFHESGVCRITAIFGPEHGFRGMHADGRKIHDDTDEKTGAAIYSLYGKIRKPTSEMLDSVDVLIYDIQDVGARFYTYITTMSLAMERAAEKEIPFVVLDRPNPIRGDRIEGPLLDMNFQSFVGHHLIPIRYSMTIGELARWINGAGHLKDSVKADLSVIKMAGWNRQLWYNETDLPWISPSPNMTHLGTATVYPGFCLLEGTNLSEGRGTEYPFLQFGAPWIDEKSYAESLNNMELAGVTFKPVTYTPITIPHVAYNPKYKNQLCRGVHINITYRNQFLPVLSMALILEKTKALYPDSFHLRAGIDRLYGSDKLRNALVQGVPVADLIESWNADLQMFYEQTSSYYLYK
jgi:uncharacterized protein YbbC (DUF1343 family)